MSAADSPKSDRTAPILDWLATDLTADADLELAALVRHLDDLGRPEISRNQFHRCLDLLHTRALAISKMHRERFAVATLPLSVSLHRSASRLVAALGKVASGYGEVLAEVQHRLVRTMRRNPEVISAKALAYRDIFLDGDLGMMRLRIDSAIADPSKAAHASLSRYTDNSR